MEPAAARRRRRRDPDSVAAAMRRRGSWLGSVMLPLLIGAAAGSSASAGFGLAVVMRSGAQRRAPVAAALSRRRLGAAPSSSAPPGESKGSRSDDRDSRLLPALEHRRGGDLITSPQSKTIRAIQSLLTSRRRRAERGEAVAEGPRIVLDLLRNPRTRGLVRQVVVSEDRWDEYRPLLLDGLAAADESGGDESVVADAGDGTRGPPEAKIQVLVATPEVLRSCTDTVTNQGMVARVRIPAPLTAAAGGDGELDRGRDGAAPPSLHVILDGVQDPGNVGTLVRSCAATGVAGLWVLPPSADVWGPKAVRSAMSATFALPMIRTDVASFDDCAESLRRDFGCARIYAATMEDPAAAQPHSKSSKPRVSIPHYQVDWAEERPDGTATALVIGGEGSGLGEGVRRALRDRPDLVRAVHVPMLAGVESLNAGVCGSVILFEYLRQVQQSQRAASLEPTIPAGEVS